MNEKIGSKNQSMVDKSEQSREAKNGFNVSGNPGLQPGIAKTKNKK